MARSAINRGSVVNDAGAESIFNAFGKVNDNFTELYNYKPINILIGQGANKCVGDSSSLDASGTDDATALQALLDAAAADGGVGDVHIPGGRTYRIGTTITVPVGVRLIGGVDNGEDTAGVPRFVWSGALDGVMFDVAQPLNNLTNVVFANLHLMGRIDGTNQPATLIKFRGTSGFAGSPDSGTYLHNVWFFGSRSHAVMFSGVGVTNMYFQGCRWDACGSASGGYGIYSDLQGGLFIHFFGHNTWTGETGCGGFIFLDCESKTTGGSFAFLKFDSLKIEVGGDLAQTYASGANPFDRRGVFRLGTNTAQGNITHCLTCDMLAVEHVPGSLSFSVFQVTATGGTDLDNARMVMLTVDGGSGLGEGTTDSTTTDVVRVIGGRVPSTRRPPFPASGRWGHFHFGLGQLSNYEHITSWSHSLNNQIDYPILGQVTTVANLESAYPKKGMRAFVTDANATTFNSVVAGGGANNVPVFHDGSSWRIG